MTNPPHNINAEGNEGGTDVAASDDDVISDLVDDVVVVVYLYDGVARRDEEETKANKTKDSVDTSVKEVVKFCAVHDAPLSG
jgi:2-hydroxy-3-keto-5-methylthiopentenyl-1-phosphate phosphatase